MTEFKQVPIEKLEPDSARGYRKDNPKITPTFVESIKTGLLQSLLVRPLEEGKYGIIHGVRRFMAVKRYTEMESLPCVVLHDIEDKEVLPLWFRLNEGERDLPKETVEEVIRRSFHKFRKPNVRRGKSKRG